MWKIAVCSGLLAALAVSWPTGRCSDGACPSDPQQVDADSDMSEEALMETTLVQRSVVGSKAAVATRSDERKAEEVEEGSDNDLDSAAEETRDHRNIICPFLSTLIHEGLLARKPIYTREELQAITIAMGLDPFTAQSHIQGNFENIPSGLIDIFDMEGNPNEHLTSTQIHDCPTLYHDCKQNWAGLKSCKAITEDCEVPNAARFDAVFPAVDLNSDGNISLQELETFAQGFPAIIDFNPIGGGTIEGSHKLILAIFGTPKNEQITLTALRRIFIDRRLPVGFVAPGIVVPPPSNAPIPRDHLRIICPFLSTLVNEGVLPEKDLYDKEELRTITIDMGLDPDSADGHIKGNFENIPSGKIDLYNMEGAPNEHRTSTNVHDCPTLYANCSEDATTGIKSCEKTMTILCQKPNAKAFNKFFREFDLDGDKYLSSAEISTVTSGFPDIVDANPIGSGTINGSHQTILKIFGSPIRKKDLKKLFVERRFPDYFIVPN